MKSLAGDFASRSHTLDLVKDLIEAGADINASDNSKRTPLHYLVNESSGSYDALTEVAELMLKNGANPCAIDEMGRMPIFYAFCKLGRLV